MLRRILVIDSQVSFSELLGEYARRICHNAEVQHYDPVAQGRPGPDFDWRRYDLLVLEVALGIPEEDGMDWLRDIRRHPDLPVTIMVSAHGDEDTVVRCMKLGADHYLAKRDISCEKFTNMIVEVFGQRGHDVSGLLDTNGAGKKINFEATTVLSRSQLREISNEGTVFIKTDAEGKVRARPAVAAQANAQKTANGSGNIEIRVPGYELLREIARGGMATVFLARRAEDQRQVVLKVVYLENHIDADVLKRFMREHTLLGKIRHKHVVRIYERAFASDFAYIAMEYFPGSHLGERIRAGVDPEKAVRYTLEIAQGLGAAHTLGMVHRDMKPPNILFRDDDTLAIVDFGIATTLGSGASITAVDELVGTPSYISPEQIGGSDADHRSDLYSVGIIFFEMLAGRRPYVGRTMRALLDAHVNTPIPKLPGNVSRFQPLIDGLLAKDPDDRFQTTDELLAGLEWS